jgi:hypothetical protein
MPKSGAEDGWAARTSLGAMQTPNLATRAAGQRAWKRTSRCTGGDSAVQASGAPVAGSVASGPASAMPRPWQANRCTVAAIAARSPPLQRCGATGRTGGRCSTATSAGSTSYFGTPQQARNPCQDPPVHSPHLQRYSGQVHRMHAEQMYQHAPIAQERRAALSVWRWP